METKMFDERDLDHRMYGWKTPIEALESGRRIGFAERIKTVRAAKMRNAIICLFIIGSVALSGAVLAAEETWKDGVLFLEEELAPVEGHKAVKIIFGLEAGKCTGEITTVSEWLVMREGTMVQSYPGKGDFERKKGEDWYQPNGTKVVVCNKSNQKAVLEGVQFRPK